MRVLVELFDREPLKNVLASCVFRPDIVVFLCDTRDATFFKESAVYRLFKRRRLKTQPRFYYLDATSPEDIRRVLMAVVRDYPGCVFNFSGGRDLVLLTAGVCAAEQALPGFYIDIPRGRLIDVRGCAHLVSRFEIPTFSAEDIFAMSGATIQGHGHFPVPQPLDTAFQRDVLNAFEVVVQNPRAWGHFVSWLQAFCAGAPAGALEVQGPRYAGGMQANVPLLQHLHRAGLLTHLTVEKSQVRLIFKSLVHRKYLLIEGVWLELFCYVVALQSAAFDDVRTSIVVDWDGVEGGPDSTKNEVDVFLVKGVTPVFISCKMSVPSALALSEIRLLSTKFGGSISRTAVVTAAHLGEEHRALKARAAELRITLLDRSTLTLASLRNALTTLAAPPPPPGRN